MKKKKQGAETQIKKMASGHWFTVFNMIIGTAFFVANLWLSNNFVSKASDKEFKAAYWANYRDNNKDIQCLR
jgi:hypothetical protein